MFEQRTITGAINNDKTHTRWRVAIGLALFISSHTAIGNSLIPDIWKNSEFAVQCTTGKMVDVLLDFSATFSVDLYNNVVLESECTGWLKYENAVSFLDSLAYSHQLDWYYFNSGLYISEKRKNEVVRLKVDVDYYQALKDIGLINKKFGWGYLENEGVAIVSGPVTYIEKIREYTGQLKKKSAVSPTMPKQKQGASEVPLANVYVLPVLHASVIDRVVEIRNKEVVIPGIVTILRSVINESDSLTAKTQTGKRGVGELLEISKKVKETSSISADVRTNSIVISSANRPREYYESIVSELDKEQKLIEIDVMIVDINRERLYEIGVKYGSQTFRGGSSGFIDNLGGGVGNVAANINIGNFARFYAELKLLEGHGDANIITNTSILTMENRPAVFDLSKTFFIESIGESVVSVEPITTGTLLNITPQSLGNGELGKVKLLIDIEDGKILHDTVGTLPIVDRSYINTKAMINVNSSLIIGGHHLKSEEKSRSSVPFLGSLPIVNNLFKSRSQRRQDHERIFIITPRLSGNYVNTEDPLQKITMLPNLQVFDLEDEMKRRLRDSSEWYVQKSMEIFKLVLENTNINTVATSKYLLLKPPLSCSQSGISFNFLNQIVYKDSGVSVYSVELTNNTTRTVAVPENSCSGSGLIATAHTGKRSLGAGSKSHMLIAVDSTKAKQK